uniref:Uncharacterized protein n=1 Tax=Glossina palpalis gambiensis TaxID=67801 RepID=A0A1B0BBT1_9MUSC
MNDGDLLSNVYSPAKISLTGCFLCFFKLTVHFLLCFLRCHFQNAFKLQLLIKPLRRVYFHVAYPIHFRLISDLISRYLHYTSYSHADSKFHKHLGEFEHRCYGSNNDIHLLPFTH